MTTRTAIYAGSFDPLTTGHLDVIRRGARLFDELVVAVGVNPAKQYWFKADERVAMVQEAAADLANVAVVSFDSLLVEAAKAHQAEVILRGLRAISDFDSEFKYGLANRDLAGIETLFILSDPGMVFVSSSLVKEIHDNGGDVSRYVPPSVMHRLEARSST